MGALTKGDRRAADASDMSEFDLDNSYGREAPAPPCCTHALRWLLPPLTPLPPQALRWVLRSVHDTCEGAAQQRDRLHYTGGGAVLPRSSREAQMQEVTWGHVGAHDRAQHKVLRGWGIGMSICI